MSRLASHRVREAVEPSGPDPTILPTLFGESQGLYRIQRSTFFLSFLLHVLAALLLFMSSTFVVTHRRQIRQQVAGLVTDISPYILPAFATKAGGGGGGGDRDKLPASRGALPKFSRAQITPPAVVVRNPNPQLAVEPTVVVPPEIRLPQIGPLGDPLPRCSDRLRAAQARAEALAAAAGAASVLGTVPELGRAGVEASVVVFIASVAG